LNKADQCQVNDQIECVQADLLHKLTHKIDLHDAEQRLEKLNNKLGGLANTRDEINGVNQALQAFQKATALTLSMKADRDKVVECVEAVRDELTEVVKKKPDLEAIHPHIQRQKEEILGATEMQIQTRMQEVQKEVTELMKDKATVALLMQTTEAMRKDMSEHVKQQVHTLKEGLGKTVHQQMDHQMHLVEKKVKAYQEAQMEQTNRDKVPRDWILSEMEQRMRAVQFELTKLVDHKVDQKQVDSCVRKVQHDLTEHVDLRVQAVQHSLSEQVEQCKQDLTEMVDCKTAVVNQQMQALTDIITLGGNVGDYINDRRHDGVADWINQDKVSAIRAYHDKTNTLHLEPSGDDNDEPFDWRAHRVKHLLTKMANPPKELTC